MRRIVICDDEKALREQLCGYLDRLGALTGEQFHITCISSGEELLARLPPDTDILLLDIQMGAISGMEAAKALRARYRDLCVIFITSQVQYALEGYAVHAFGFLRKPVQFGQFRQQLTDALASLSARQGVMVTLKAAGETHRFNCNDIYYIEVQGHTVFVSLRDGKRECSANLGALEEQLGPHGFFRCHKSVLINLRLIQKIGQTDILMLNGGTVPLSRHRRQDFLIAFSQQTGGTQ